MPNSPSRGGLSRKQDILNAHTWKTASQTDKTHTIACGEPSLASHFLFLKTNPVHTGWHFTLSARMNKPLVPYVSGGFAALQLQVSVVYAPPVQKPEEFRDQPTHSSSDQWPFLFLHPLPHSPSVISFCPWLGGKDIHTPEQIKSALSLVHSHVSSCRVHSGALWAFLRAS